MKKQVELNIFICSTQENQERFRKSSVSGTLNAKIIFLILELVPFIKQKMLKKMLLYLLILMQKQTTQAMFEVFKRLLYFNALFYLKS